MDQLGKNYIKLIHKNIDQKLSLHNDTGDSKSNISKAGEGGLFRVVDYPSPQTASYLSLFFYRSNPFLNDNSQQTTPKHFRKIR